jgi:CheY-like chemotaxis protein
MRILVAEDDPNKIKQVAKALAELSPTAEVVERRSFQSSLKAALEIKPDLILLDMSMPNYEVSPDEPGGPFRQYAGREILRAIKHWGLRSKVIIVTQYESFDEGGEMMTLEQLKAMLARDFIGTYVGTVFYRPSESSWREELINLVKKVINRIEAEMS